MLDYSYQQIATSREAQTNASLLAIDVLRLQIAILELNYFWNCHL
ncbi:MAG TPA: hypothetical protein VIH86_09390 [Puia sp.]